MFVHKSPLGAFGRADMHLCSSCLSRMGHEVYFVAKSGGESDELKADGVRVLTVSDSKSWVKEICRLVYELKPDIAHVFLYSGAGLVSFFARKYSPTTRFVLDVRSPLLRTGLWRMLHRVKNVFEPRFFDGVAAHGIESGWTQLGKRDDLVLLPPGVDSSLVTAERPVQKAADDVVKMIYIGSLSRLRSLRVMLESIVQAHCRSLFEVDIYGDGDDKSFLERYISESSCRDSVHFKGVVDRRTLFQLMPAYDVGLAYIPSGMYEFAPALKSMEYLACGVPVLATDTCGNRMFIENGVNGELSKGDVESFAAAIVRICNQEKLNGYKDNVAQSVDEYDWMRIIKDRLLPFYDGLIGG
ncbi:MAG: glycosyltransferase [Proteobacteria bacterium]|nr:glycosyltransferase [Pseudomonadota bacterium]